MQDNTTKNNIYDFNITVEKVLYKADNSSFHILRFSTNDDIPAIQRRGAVGYGSLIGNSVDLSEGDKCKVKAELTHNEKFGDQYKIISLNFDKPTTKEGVLYFLSGIMAGSKAYILYNAHPDVLDQLTRDNKWEPDYNLTKGIKQKSWIDTRKKILDNLCYAELISLLSPVGVTLDTIQKLGTKEKNVTLLRQKIINNPYILCDFPYMGFKKVDRYALQLNPGLKGSTIRAKRGLVHILNEEEENTGSSYANVEDVKIKLSELLDEEIEELYDSICEEEMFRSEKERTFFIDDDRIGLYRTYNMEKFICEKLMTIKNTDNVWNISDEEFNQSIDLTCEEQGFRLSDEQIEAVRSIMNNNITVISGKGGTGKTSVIKAILEVYKIYDINMAALSAKAARRMREVTNYPATTIHSMLGWQKTQFRFNENNPLDCQLLILDECSMNNIFLFYSILKAVGNNTKIVFAGDHAQLPPIGAGSVFMDLIKNNIFNNHQLTKVYRQSEDAYIVLHANEIREGNMPFEINSGKMAFGEDTLYLFMNDSERIANWAVNLYMQLIEKYGMEEVCIVCPRKDSVVVSCQKINEKIQNALLEEIPSETICGKEFRVGCRIINRKNNHEFHILNGDMGTITAFYGTDVVINFDEYGEMVIPRSAMANIDLGYAISVHSSQGSQYKVVIIAMDYSSYTLLSCNLIYTAMTRATEKLITLTQAGAFQKAVNNIEENNRSTFLQDFLQDKDFLQELSKEFEHKQEIEKNFGADFDDDCPF